MSPPSPSPMIQGGQDISAQNRRLGQGNQGAAQDTFSQFEGPVAQSPFYKALLGAGTDATTNAYQTAQSNIRGRAKAAGFGDNQPVTQGAEDQNAAQEASTMAGLPGKTMVEAAGPALEAARGTAGIGASQQSEAVPYYQSSTQLEDQYQQQRAQSQQALWKALSQAASLPIGKGTITV